MNMQMRIDPNSGDTAQGGLDPWRGFQGADWQRGVDVRDFIQKNVVPYEGDQSFLAGVTPRTEQLWGELKDVLKAERDNGGVLDVDSSCVSTIVSHGPGYIDKDLERIVGLQTDAPLKRAVMPFGGWRMVKNGLDAYGFKGEDWFGKVFPAIRKTHNDGVFDVYTPEMLKCRKSGIITGLPDAYGRGRIIGDYRRVALYGIDKLIEVKQAERSSLEVNAFDESVMRLREELAEQIKALKELAQMGKSYGFDLMRPALNAQEAMQWLYLGYLAAVKEANGAAMSLGRVSSFLDIYIERDLDEGTIDETEVQELYDHFVMKLRIVRFLRTPEYDQLFSGDPTWVTESIGGMGIDGRTLVTRSSFRILHTLTTLGPAPEPNLTV
ncbi:MAG: pyruvate formate lyase family protein, partial [Ancalomicrobiaceae bacterium]|nr:pyruvate formate lyase family protein [Ancalomicrobiaceae bacterium]